MFKKAIVFFSVCCLMLALGQVHAQALKTVKKVGVILLKKDKHKKQMLLMGASDGTYASFKTSQPLFFNNILHPIWGIVVSKVKKADQDKLREIAPKALSVKTHKVIQLDPSVFLSLPRIYASKAKLQLYFYRDDQIRLDKINKKLKKVHFSKRRSKYAREFAYFDEIPVQTILQAIRCVKRKAYPLANTACYQAQVYPKRYTKRKKRVKETIYLDKTIIDVLARQEKAFKKAIEQVFRIDQGILFKQE